MKQDQLTRLETIIARNQGHFCDIGRALKEIRDNRLYKLTLFETFEAYTNARWDMGRAQAYRLIKSYEIIRNLSPIGDILPANECQVRSLARLNPVEQRRAWKDFIDSGMEMTALNIRKFIGTEKGNKSKSPDLSDQISKDYMTAVLLMMEQVRVARHGHWRQTSRQAALLWNRVIQEKILSRESDNG
jgi:hypothetical protein